MRAFRRDFLKILPGVYLLKILNDALLLFSKITMYPQRFSKNSEFSSLLFMVSISSLFNFNNFWSTSLSEKYFIQSEVLVGEYFSKLILWMLLFILFTFPRKDFLKLSCTSPLSKTFLKL